MNEKSLTSISELVPGDAILLENVDQLAAFEDAVAYEIDPSMTQGMRDAWMARAALKELIRPAKHRGRISDITLIVMDEPFERLMDARERGWRFQRTIYGTELPGGSQHHTKDETAIDSYQGYILTANAHSSGRGVIGQVQSELWYRRVRGTLRETAYTIASGETRTYQHRGKKTSDNGGRSIRRYIAVPKVEPSAFIELDETSRRIGMAVLRRNMMHPIIQPVRN